MATTSSSPRPVSLYPNCQSRPTYPVSSSLRCLPLYACRQPKTCMPFSKTMHKPNNKLLTRDCIPSVQTTKVEQIEKGTNNQGSLPHCSVSTMPQHPPRTRHIVTAVHQAIPVISSSNTANSPFTKTHTINMLTRRMQFPTPETIEDAVCQYIDFLICENERQTQLRDEGILYSSNENNYSREQYFFDVMSRPLDVPTQRFRDWLRQVHNVEVELNDGGQIVSHKTLQPSPIYSKHTSMLSPSCLQLNAPAFPSVAVERLYIGRSRRQRKPQSDNLSNFSGFHLLVDAAGQTVAREELVDGRSVPAREIATTEVQSPISCGNVLKIADIASWTDALLAASERALADTCRPEWIDSSQDSCPADVSANILQPALHMPRGDCDNDVKKPVGVLQCDSNTTDVTDISCSGLMPQNVHRDCFQRLEAALKACDADLNKLSTDSVPHESGDDSVEDNPVLALTVLGDIPSEGIGHAEYSVELQPARKRANSNCSADFNGQDCGATPLKLFKASLD